MQQSLELAVLDRGGGAVRPPASRPGAPAPGGGRRLDAPSGRSGKRPRSSQGPSEPRSRTRNDPARRTRTRNVAWKASSAACAVAEHLPADGQDHRPMAGQDRLEGGLRRLIPPVS